MPKHGIYYFCKAKIDRALDSNKLKSLCEAKNIFGESYGSVTAAFDAAKKNALNEDLILIGGSTFVVAEVL